MVELDNLKVNFDAESLWILNFLIAIIMFGVALDIKVSDFKRLFQNPRILFTGIVSQLWLIGYLSKLGLPNNFTP